MTGKYDDGPLEIESLKVLKKKVTSLATASDFFTLLLPPFLFENSYDIYIKVQGVIASKTLQGGKFLLDSFSHFQGLQSS